MRYTLDYYDGLRKIREAIPNLSHLYGKRVLITGAGGLICSAAVDFLMYLNRTEHAGIHVYAAARSREKVISRFAPWVTCPDFEFLPYDALQEIPWDLPFDYLIHGAGNANPGAYVREPAETMLANILGIRNLLDYVRRQGFGRILYISSSEVYGRKDSAEPYRETDYGSVDILNPRACYPSSKRAAETLCASYLSEYRVDSVIVRPGHVYGPTANRTDNRASSQFPRDVLEGHDIIMKSAGTQMRSYCYVLDCVSAIFAVLLNGQSGSAYNISNPDSVVSIRQMADAFARAGGRTVVFENPTDAEIQGYNLMDNSSLYSDSLEALGWQGKFCLDEGAEATLLSMEL